MSENVADEAREKLIDEAYQGLLLGKSLIDQQAAFTRMKILVRGRSKKRIQEMEKNF